MSGDMKQAIIPKSDQLNADDLLSGPTTIKITGITVRGGQEQPVSISYENDHGKPYKPCKSMCRVLVTAWGPDSSQYVGRSLTLYCDPKVKWGGMEVGGIRISHMSSIEATMTMALTVTRGNKKPFIVNPIPVQTYDYDAALDAMRGAKSWPVVVAAYTPAAKRASADKDRAAYDALTNCKEEMKAILKPEAPPPPAPATGSISGDPSEGDLNIPALGGKAVI